MNISPIKPWRGLSVKSIVSPWCTKRAKAFELQSWSSLALDNRSRGTINPAYSFPLYSPYLAMKAFWLCLKIKCAFQELRLAAIETMGKTMPELEKAVAERNGNLRRQPMSTAANNGCMIGISMLPPKGPQRRTVFTGVVCVVTWWLLAFRCSHRFTPLCKARRVCASDSLCSVLPTSTPVFTFPCTRKLVTPAGDTCSWSVC